MTRDILQSDIDLAIRLRDELRPGAEIIQALARRGIDSARAAQLVDDLKNGRDVEAQATVPSEFTLRQRKRVEHRKPEPASAAPPQLRRNHPPRRGTSGTKASRAAWWVVMAPLGVLIVVLGAILIERRLAAVRARTEPAPAAPKAGLVAPRKPRGTAAVAAPALELHPDGLRIGGKPVTRENPFATVVEALGAPSRTNRVEASGATVFAYDRLGVLVYVEPAGRTNSIMLDCDATGGDHGTALPFAGTLKIGEEIIGPNTDAQMLAGLKVLGLRNMRDDGSLWSGRYGTLALVFAYLKSPQRLSLIEIDLE